MNTEFITKEEIGELHFVSHDILTDAKEKLHRKFLLEEAMTLGNDFKHKVRIIFHTTVGIKMVETTVWAVTDSHIELKAGKDIPILCISEVIL